VKPVQMMTKKNSKNQILLDQKIRQLKVPRPPSDDDKELYSIIARDVFTNTTESEEDSKIITLANVIGLNEAKEALEDTLLLPLQHPEIYKEQLTKVNGLLLVGPPGTGKTLLAKALANQSKSTVFFNVHSSSLASKWRGDSEKLVRILFELAYHNAPSIIFIDEIEAILSERGSQGEHEASKRAKAEFLIHLDGIRSRKYLTNEPVLFLASTNLPWNLDPAIIRRFQKVIPVDLPNAKERLEIFRQCLKGHDISGLDLKVLANADSVNFSGSDIQRSCSNAINKLLRRKVASKNSSNDSKLEKKLTMTDMNECMKRETPMSNQWRRKYDNWCKQV